MGRLEIDIRATAIDNVIQSFAYSELGHKLAHGEINRHEFAAEFDEMIQSEIGYLNSREYLREQAREQEGEDRRAG